MSYGDSGPASLRKPFLRKDSDAIHQQQPVANGHSASSYSPPGSANGFSDNTVTPSDTNFLELSRKAQQSVQSLQRHGADIARLTSRPGTEAADLHAALETSRKVATQAEGELERLGSCVATSPPHEQAQRQLVYEKLKENCARALRTLESSAAAHLLRVTGRTKTGKSPSPPTFDSPRKANAPATHSTATGGTNLSSWNDENNHHGDDSDASSDTME